MTPVVRLVQLGATFDLDLSPKAPSSSMQCGDPFVQEAELYASVGLDLASPRSPEPMPLEKVAKDSTLARWAIISVMEHWVTHGGGSDGPGSSVDRQAVQWLTVVWDAWAQRDPALGGAAAWWLTFVSRDDASALGMLDTAADAIRPGVSEAIACNVERPTAAQVAVTFRDPPATPRAAARAAIWQYESGSKAVAVDRLSTALPQLYAGWDCTDTTKQKSTNGVVYLSSQDNCNTFLRKVDPWLVKMAVDGQVTLASDDWRSALALGLWSCGPVPGGNCVVHADVEGGSWQLSSSGTCKPEFEACVRYQIQATRPPAADSEVVVWD